MPFSTPSPLTSNEQLPSPNNLTRPTALYALLLPPLSATQSLGLWRRTPAEIKSPSEMISIRGSYTEKTGELERTPGVAGINRSRPAGLNTSEIAVQALADLLGRHAGMVNVLFVDGHVDAFTLSDLFFDRSEASRRRWNFDNEAPPRTPAPAVNHSAGR